MTVALLARRVRGTIEDVSPDGRVLTVLTEEGELMEFGLSQATGYFTGGGVQSGARLSFDD
ncbi:MAG: hypothetical protein QOF55_2410 [Thermoleophilaceae bacterium]|nr:hypothetical protein [Thermoleophilaceae bacterium]